MKKKTLTVSKAKTRAWMVFSKYIRIRDCLKTTRTKEQGNCYTCGTLKDIKDLQAGHFIPGRFPVFLFDENQVHAQCYSCNIGLKGNWPRYYENMVRDHGRGVVDNMIRQKNDFKQFKVYELLRIESKYKDYLIDLEK